MVSVTLTNASPTNLSVRAALANGKSYAGYMVSRDSRVFESIRPMFIIDPHEVTTIFRPGDTFRHEQMLVYNGRTGRSAFPTEGDYFIRVDYRGRKSNVLKIQVKAAESPADVKWTERLSSKDVLQLRQRHNCGKKALSVAANRSKALSSQSCFWS